MNKIDLQEKLEILQNFAYDNPDKDLTEKIKGNISLKDIKFSNKSSIIGSIKEQSLGKVSFINFLPMSNTIVLNGKNLPITLFLNPYMNNKDMKDNKNPFNIDSAISYLLSPLVINKVIPNLLLPLVNFDIKFSDLPAPLLTVPIFTSMEKKIKNGKMSEMISVRVRENFNKMTSLHTRISNSSNKNKIDLKPIIFQVIYSLAKLDQEYPGFKHNSLDSHSIFLNNTSKNIKYQFNDTNYYLDIRKNFVKIGNFSSSYVPKMFKSKNTSDKKFNMMKDKAFDAHYFLNSLVYRDINKKNVANYDEMSEFIDRVLPKKLRGSNKNKYYLSEKSKMKSLKDILSDKYFDEYKIRTKEKINVMVSSEEMRKLEKYTGMTGSEDENSKGTRKIKKREMEGGYFDHSKPIKNNPNISNDKREVFKKRIAEKPKPREPPVLLEQKIYNPSTSKPTRPKPVQPFVPINQHTNMPIVNYPYPYANILNKVPIQKIYNITIGDPGITGNFIGDFYEDMIPSSPYPLNSLSLEDRIKLRGYVRNILIEKMDGEEMNITGGKKSFRKYVKWGPFNPYSLSNNPYDDIGSKFTLYSVFYPMRYDEEKKIFNVAKDATSFNIRTYDLSIGSLYSDRLTDEMKLENFNVFRELRYYKFILSEIINKKVSPNFVNLILYKIDKATKIKYQKLVEFKMRHLPKALRDIAYKPIDIVASIDEQIRNARTFLNHFKVKYPTKRTHEPSIEDLEDMLEKKSSDDKKYSSRDSIEDPSILNDYIKKIIEDPEKRAEAEKLVYAAGLTLDDIPIKGDYGAKKEKIAIYQSKMKQLRNILSVFGLKRTDFDNFEDASKKSLILMTEGPTHNILRWASPAYNKNGSQNIMIGTGYHTEEAWMSVYFQIIHAMMVLEKHEIYFRELSLDKNIFIKDVYYDGGNVGYWKYIVNDVSYYVPNLGYIVMFDSSYSDKVDIFNMKKTIDKTEFEKVKGKEDFKIISTELFEINFSKKEIDDLPSDSETDQQNHIRALLRKDIANILDPTNLSNRLKHMKGIQPTDNFIKTLTSIHQSYVKGDTLADILLNNFSDYLHSRIGTSLSNSEMNNVSLIPVRNLERGKMVIYQERFGEYKWAMYAGNDSVPGKHMIVDERAASKTPKSVFLASLRSYPNNLPVEHVFRKGHKYMEEDLIDTYRL